MKNLERIIEITPAYDRRKEGYGIHSCEMRFLVKGEMGAIQFLLFTGWFLPETRDTWLMQDRNINVFETVTRPLPADIGYHSLKPMWEGQEEYKRDVCPFLDGKPCYYDGSGLNAEKYFDILVRQGSDALWKALEDYYQDRFIASDKHAKAT